MKAPVSTLQKIINYFSITGMKKIIFITLLATMTGLPCFSNENATKQKNTVEALFKIFAEEKGVITMKMDGFKMDLVRFLTLNDTIGINGAEVYVFDNCDSQVKERLQTSIKNLKDDAYETLFLVSQDGERVKILVKVKEDYINEIVVVVSGNNLALIKIKGKIKPEDVQNVIKNNY